MHSYTHGLKFVHQSQHWKSQDFKKGWTSKVRIRFFPLQYISSITHRPVVRLVRTPSEHKSGFYWLPRVRPEGTCHSRHGLCRSETCWQGVTRLYVRNKTRTLWIATVQAVLLAQWFVHSLFTSATRVQFPFPALVSLVCGLYTTQ